VKRRLENLLRSGPPLALVGVLVLVGFLLVVTGTATSVAARNEEPRKQALIDQIVRERRDVSDLDQAVDTVRRQLDDLHSQSARQSDEQSHEREDEQQLALRAGTVALHGSGITVKLSDAPRSAGEEQTSFDAARIQDSDIQLVVNALFSAGAEAVAVNDNRVVAVTPIRAAGGTIVVNYRPVSSPYRIVAIGASKDEFRNTEIAHHFEQWKKKFDLGYSIDSGKNLKVPAYSGRTSISIASPVVGPH
jgi:uncharacterized protein YlxW (UPF0749 family)